MAQAPGSQGAGSGTGRNHRHDGIKYSGRKDRARSIRNVAEPPRGGRHRRRGGSAQSGTGRLLVLNRADSIPPPSIWHGGCHYNSLARGIRHGGYISPRPFRGPSFFYEVWLDCARARSKLLTIGNSCRYLTQDGENTCRMDMVMRGAGRSRSGALRCASSGTEWRTFATSCTNVTCW